MIPNNHSADRGDPQGGSHRAGMLVLVGGLVLMLTGYAVIVRYVGLRKDQVTHECEVQMKQFSGAVKSWALENRKTSGTRVQPEDIASFLRGGTFPPCPSGGIYIMGVGSDAYGRISCTEHGELK